jgi:hypothetical protein
MENGSALFGGGMTKASQISPFANISEFIILFLILLLWVLPFQFSIVQMI